MAGFEHLLKSYDIGDELDDIASSDPPAYLRRCFADAGSTARGVRDGTRLNPQ
jgi:hypothetical protein